jgi:hypothetical protein
MSKSLNLTLSWFTSNGTRSQMSCSYYTSRRGSAGSRTPSWTGTIFNEIEQQKIHILSADICWHVTEVEPVALCFVTQTNGVACYVLLLCHVSSVSAVPFAYICFTLKWWLLVCYLWDHLQDHASHYFSGRSPLLSLDCPFKGTGCRTVFSAVR